jgi:hypothetical protein
VVEEARILTRMLLAGQDIPESCRKLCQRLGVGESLLRTRLWAVASLFPDQHSSTASPYEILGVEPWSEQDDIKRAFRALCLKWHPDHNQDDPEAVTRFRQIKAAYDMVNDPVASQGWTPPAGVNVWEEPGPCEEKRTWTRLRLLAPLGLVVGLLILAVGFVDELIHYPRHRSVSRDTSQQAKVLPDLTLPALEDSAQQGVREPLVLPSPSAGQTAPETEARSSIQAPAGPDNSIDVHGNVSQDSLPALAGVQVRQDVVASEAGRGGDPNPIVAVADFEAAGKGAQVLSPAQKSGPAPAPASPPADDMARSGVKLSDVPSPPDSKAPRDADGVFTPSAPDGTVAEKPASAAARPGREASPEFARKGESPAPDPAEPQKKLRDPVASESLPPAAPTPPAQDVRVDEAVPMNGGAALVDLHGVEERLKKFLATYVRDYSRRDLKRFMTHFAPSALENGKPLEDMHPLYEENFRNISTIRYRIMVDSMSVGTDQVRFKGRFELRGLHADGQPILSQGNLNMDLEPFETTFRVRSLEYTFR